jgi:lysophospholipase L1-like esterase
LLGDVEPVVLSSSTDRRVAARVCGALLLLLAAACVAPRSSSDPGPGPQRVAVIGDSLFASIKEQLDADELPDVAYSRSWLITARSGFGWTASSPTWPLSVIRGTWAIGVAKHLLLQHPATVVVELGTDDALRATFADILDKPELARQIRAAIATNIGYLLAETDKASACTVLVTPTTFPTTLFGTGNRYSNEAKNVDSLLVSTTQGQAGRVLIANWAEYSAAHHRALSDPGNWFLADGVHPNATGERALVALVDHTMTLCPRTGA